MGKYCTRVMEKVLFPTDFSQPAEAALSFLKSLEGVDQVVLLSVVSKGETQEEIDANASAAQEKMDAALDDLVKAGKNVKALVVVGNPVDEIKKVAENEDVSLIAMSSQGAVAVKKGRIGSTAYDVANSANRPVLILRRSKIALYYV